MSAALILSTIVALAASRSQELRVRLNVFSGSHDPEWTVDAAGTQALLSKFHSDMNELPLAIDEDGKNRPIPWFKLGYRGFEITLMDTASALNGAELAVYNVPALERALLATGMDSNGPLFEFPAVISHVKSEIERVIALNVSRVRKSVMEQIARARRTIAVGGRQGSVDNCTIPVRGSDTSTLYDPKTENCGYFVKYETDNNCYDYGCDIVTNTFAQPGRGSGKKWSANTCADMRASAERDGLEWAGTTLPARQPAKGHFVALLIWPNTNFHWIRLDDQPQQGFWSHKPGQTPARNVDSNGKTITDPSKSNFSPWTQFCGYMSVVPSVANIN